jgi:trigger factor
VWEFYQKNPGALASIRAPIFEEKVVDFLLELATVSEKQVSREELLKDDEDEKSAAS